MLSPTLLSSTSPWCYLSPFLVTHFLIVSPTLLSSTSPWCYLSPFLVIHFLILSLTLHSYTFLDFISHPSYFCIFWCPPLPLLSYTFLEVIIQILILIFFLDFVISKCPTIDLLTRLQSLRSDRTPPLGQIPFVYKCINILNFLIRFLSLKLKNEKFGLKF